MAGALALDAEDRFDLHRCAALLDASPDFRVLRRLDMPSSKPSFGSGPHRAGIFVDVETTGLDPDADRVIELAMLAFTYALDGSVCAAGESFTAFLDPGRPIPDEIVRLTGIDDATVAGRALDLSELKAFVDNADIVIAHNASFDRPFCERLSPVFAERPWACSYREVPWSEEGFDGARLGQLAAGHGFFFDGHRALSDCQAGLEVLARPLPRTGRTALSVLLESARGTVWRIHAADAPFAARGVVKDRGYRWDDGSKGGPRAWYIDVPEEAVDSERDFLRRHVYRRDRAIEAQAITAWDRYSDRCRRPLPEHS